VKQYRRAKKRISLSVGKSVRILRELQELSQNQLFALTDIPQATLSAIENDRVRLGVERGKGSCASVEVSSWGLGVSWLGSCRGSGGLIWASTGSAGTIKIGDMSPGFIPYPFQPLCLSPLLFAKLANGLDNSILFPYHSP